MKRSAVYLSLAGLLFLTGCAKDNTFRPTGGVVEFYLIDTYQTSGPNFQIDETTVSIKGDPLVLYPDLLTYDSSAHSFEILDAARERISNLEHSAHGIAFALIADRELIYTGYFWPSYSSAVCEWVTIDPLQLFSGNTLTVNLGYPGEWPGVPDRRNDPRLLEILERDNKLIR